MVRKVCTSIEINDTAYLSANSMIHSGFLQAYQMTRLQFRIPTCTAPLTLPACSPAVLTYRMYVISGHHYSGALVAFKIRGEEYWTRYGQHASSLRLYVFPSLKKQLFCSVPPKPSDGVLLIAHGLATQPRVCAIECGSGIAKCRTGKQARMTR